MSTRPEDEARPGAVRSARRLVQLLVGLALVSLVFELFIHKHVEIAIQAWPGFDGVFGFVAMVALALGARGLQQVLQRPEDYYDG